MEVIHIVLGKANPDRMNGVNKVVYQLATRQTEHGLDVSVWGISSSTDRNFGERNFKTRIFKKSFNPFKADPLLLKNLLAKKGKAVFHIHGGWIPVFSTISRFLNQHNIPYIFTPHGAYNSIAMKRSGILKKIYFHFFENAVVRFATKIHCIGSSEVDGLRKIHATDKVVLLPYGFDEKNQAIDQQTKGDDMIIGFVGRLDMYTKGLDLLLTAFKNFQNKIPNSKLWIIGNGNDYKKIQGLVESKGLGSSVVLYGGKFGEEKNTLIKQMSVFAHPSRNEGLPSSVLEACNFGVPCIVTKATNVGEYIEQFNAGLSIENENSFEIEFALYQFYALWKSDALTQMKTNAQHMVKTIFDWNRLIFDFNKLYNLN